MSAGWIKLHRQFRENPFYTNSTAVHLWLECLLRASHEDRTFYSKRTKVDLKPGQFVMGYREMARIAGCGVATAKYWLDQFSSERMIERESNVKGSLVTIKNWNQFQEDERISEHKQNTGGTLMESNKNDKKVKNEKNDESSNVQEIKESSENAGSLRSPTPAEQVRKFLNDESFREEIIQKIILSGTWEEEYLRTEIKKFINHWTEPTHSGRKQLWQTKKSFEIRRRLTTWLNNSLKFSQPRHAR